MSAQNSAGIQILRDAETEAQKIVQKARECQFPSALFPTSVPYRARLTRLPEDRTKRVKDARSEAQKEIDEYRQQKEDEFKKFEKEKSSGNKKAEEDAGKDADAQVKGIKEAGKKSGDEIVEELLRIVMEVKPEPPKGVDTSS